MSTLSFGLATPLTKDAIGEWRVILTLIPIRPFYQTSAGMASVGDGRLSMRRSASLSTVSLQAVSEIKHAPCTRCAHFQGRVHDFQRGAPGLCTLFQSIIITTYWEGALRSSRVHSFMKSAPGGCTIQKLNFGH